MSSRRLLLLVLLIAACAVLAPDAHAWLTYTNSPGRFTPPAGGPGTMNYSYDPAGAPLAYIEPTGSGIIAAAHQTWNDDRGSQTAFAQTVSACDCTNNLDAVNCIGWNAGASGPLAATAVRSAAAGTLHEFDICINSGITEDLQSVLLHQFGHALGLDHPDAGFQVPQTGQNGQRPAVDYMKAVMRSADPPGFIKQVLTCDDKAGVSFLYPPAAVVMEGRVYLTGNSGGCDFGDAPDPRFLLMGAVGEYPSLENGEDTIINGLLDADRDDPPLGNFPGTEDIDWNLNGIVDFTEERNNPLVFPEPGNGARHKDSRMEWLGPVDLMVGLVSLPVPIPRQLPTFIVRNLVIPAPPNGFVAGFPGSVIAGQTGDPGPAVPASATFEPEARLVSLDELDDGMSQRAAFVPGMPVTIDILVNTSGLASGRYDPNEPNQRLYLNVWADWNGDGDWKDWAAPIAGGNNAPPVLPCVRPVGSDEFILHWEGTPTADVAASPNFCGSTPAGPDARYLTFVVTPPEGAVWDGRIHQRYRLDYGENVGQILRDFSDLSLVIPGPPPRAVTPGDRLGTHGFEQGEAKYGEVEDYGPIEVDYFPDSVGQVDIRIPPESPQPHIIELEGPTLIEVDLGSLADPNGLGREEVQTEVITLDLAGGSSLLGDVTVRLRDPEDCPFERSTGKIREHINATPGELDLPPFTSAGTARSYFDIFFEVAVLFPVPMTLHNHDPKIMIGGMAHKPPDSNTIYEAPIFIDLFDEDHNLMARLGAGLHIPDPNDMNGNPPCRRTPPWRWRDFPYRYDPYPGGYW